MLELDHQLAGTPVDQLIASCDEGQALRLVAFDHHAVRVRGRLGVMLTYEWPPVDEAPPTYPLRVVFHPAARQHPPAPPEVQAVVDRLEFVRAPPRMS